MPRAATALRLAAAPTFAVLALLNSGAGTDMLCLHTASPLTGMSLMYGLMCVFHLAPWLGLIARSTR
jgi:hypothetical protein